MRTLTNIVTKWPWLTIAIIAAVTVFFGYQLQFVKIDNEVKEFLPETEDNRQQLYRSMEVFGAEFLAIVGISVDENGPYDSIFNPAALHVVAELTEFFQDLEIEGNFEHSMWVKPEDAAKLIAERGKGECSPERLKEVVEAPIPEDLTDYVQIWVCKAPRIAQLDDVVSLATMTVIYDEEVPPSVEGGEPEHRLMIEDLWESPPKTPAETAEVARRIRTWDMYLNNVVSEPDPSDGKIKATAIYAFMPNGVNIEYTEKLQKLMDEKIAELNRPGIGLQIETGGIPMISVWLGRYLQADLRKLIPFVFGVILLVLIFSFRTPLGVAMPFATVVAGTIWTVGLTPLVGKALTLTTSAIPTLITAVGSAYTIHIVHHFLEARRHGMDKHAAVHDAMDRVGLAVIMAGLTTVGGFLSLTTSTVIPIKDFGLLASFGALACLLISVTMVPAMLIAFARNTAPAKKDADDSGHDPAAGPLGFALRHLAHFVATRRKTVAAASLLVGAIVVLLSAQVRVTSDMVRYFKDDSEIATSDRYLKKHFGGTNIFFLTFDGGESNYWKDPAKLAKLDELSAFIDSKFGAQVGKFMSVNDYIKKMWQAFEYDRPEGYRLPPTKQGVADMLFMFSNKSDALDSVIDFDYRRVRLSIKIASGQTRLVADMKAAIDGWLTDNWPEMAGTPAPPPTLSNRVFSLLGLVRPAPRVIGARFGYSGESFIRYTVDRLIVIGQMRSVFLSLLVVFVLAMIIFRSVIGGLLAVVPAGLAVLGNFGVMGLLDIPLDVGTALVAAAAVGIGIDYAIHYINRYRQSRQDGAGAVEAVRLTHLTSGKAIVFNAAAVALGFFVLIFSNFNPMIRMGLLTGMTMITASLISLTILPVLLIWLRPRFIRKVATTETEK
jgi:uncharacterized protein